MTPEGRIQKSILEYLNLIGAFVWRNNTTGIYDVRKKCFRRNNGNNSAVGSSDILGIYKGTFLALEVKTKYGKTTPYQQLFIDKINQRGGIAGVCKSVDDVIELLKKPRYIAE